jgi:DNA-binding CsgD family transcriptional regulator
MPHHHVTISTSHVEPPERHAYWADLVCAHLVKVNCLEVTQPARFSGHIEQRQLGALSVSRIRSQAQRLRLTPEVIAQSSEEQVLVNIQRRGTSVVRQDGREAALVPGDIALYTSDRPYELAFEASFEQTVLIMPAQAIRAWVPDLHRSTATTLPCAHPTATLLRHAAETLFEYRDLVATDALSDVVGHLVVGCASEIIAKPPRHAGECQAVFSKTVAPDVDSRPWETPEKLTPKESAVLGLMAKGCSYVEVADCLGVSVDTVRTHVRGLYAKLGVHSKNEAVFEAGRIGWLKN